MNYWCKIHCMHVDTARVGIILHQTGYTTCASVESLKSGRSGLVIPVSFDEVYKPQVCCDL